MASPSQLLSPSAPPGPSLQDVRDYAQPAIIPDVPWLARLPLDEPRTNLDCLSPRTRWAKRATDVVLAAIMLLVLLPVMLAVVVAVRLTSPGPVIFRQTRVGLNLRGGRRERHREQETPAADGSCRRSGSDRRVEHAYGRHFVLYKFRTMRVDAERDGAQFAVKGDKRVTPIGRFLRKTRLDELPQLWNVLKGEMSLVGPRPERPEFIEGLSAEIPNYLQRLGLRPGLTGVAQIVNGYDNDLDGFRRKVAFDVLYLQNCSWWNDLRILLRTVRVVLSGSGAL